jgi:hypothetical protein
MGAALSGLMMASSEEKAEQREGDQGVGHGTAARVTGKSDSPPAPEG